MSELPNHPSLGLWYPDQPCQLVAYHAPEPVIVQGHHIHPQFLQNRVWGNIRDNDLKWLCGSCHDSVHAWLYWLLGEHVQPPRCGYAARAEAKRSFDWYVSEGGTVA